MDRNDRGRLDGDPFRNCEAETSNGLAEERANVTGLHFPDVAFQRIDRLLHVASAFEYGGQYFHVFPHAARLETPAQPAGVLVQIVQNAADIGGRRVWSLGRWHEVAIPAPG